MSDIIEAKHEEVVKNYFDYIRQLRNGDAEAVERLLALWDDDGTFEFAGSPPVNGTFRGKNAIHVLYKNRLLASGMHLQFEGAPLRNMAADDIRLGIVDTEVKTTRPLEQKIVSAWQTTIGTSDGRGFEVAGSHVFTFENGKIKTLKITISPRPERTEREALSLESLTVSDIGRLALAAWAVV